MSLLEPVGISCICHNFLVKDPVVLFNEVVLVYQVTFQEAGITRILNFNLPHHLRNDDLDVFIIDIDVLRTVHVLNFTDEVPLQRLFALDPKNIVRNERPVRQGVAGLDALPRLDVRLGDRATRSDEDGSFALRIPLAEGLGDLAIGPGSRLELTDLSCDDT